MSPIKNDRTPADRKLAKQRIYIKMLHRTLTKTLAGSRIELIHTDDPYTKLKPGAMGTINLIDHFGTIHVNWDDGSTLGLVPQVDKYIIKCK